MNYKPHIGAWLAPKRKYSEKCWQVVTIEADGVTVRWRDTNEPTGFISFRGAAGLCEEGYWYVAPNGLDRVLDEI